jgi:hybrid cluster-associated redox disulfide protein
MKRKKQKFLERNLNSVGVIAKIKMKAKSAKKKIHKKMTFYELIQEDRGAAMHLAEKGMFCCGCPMALTETIEQGAKAHGIIPEDLIEELNKRKRKKK